MTRFGAPLLLLHDDCQPATLVLMKRRLMKFTLTMILLPMFSLTMFLLTMCFLTMFSPSYAVAAADETAAAQFFEQKVRPILVAHCWDCHGEKKQWGGLRLDSRAALLKGGDSGPAVVPGRAAESLLIRAVHQTDPDLRMPRDGKLTALQIADLVAWVNQGAYLPPRAVANRPRGDASHWAFQPVVARPLPAVQDRSWPCSGIDSWIQESLERRGLQAAAPADPVVMLRRLSYDLTGLPPRRDQFQEFYAERLEPDLLARWVDRFLAMPQYGERWGRHWLDVARYADSNGLDENIAHGNAWRYRDYVVDAFNADLPFQQFVVEQLAGDQLASQQLAGQQLAGAEREPPMGDQLDCAQREQQHRQLIATGFLSIGPKVLAEVNQAKMRMDIVDEQIDTVGRVFLGLTLGCARCHDHKFDPIDIQDYYGLAGIFKSTRTMISYQKVAKWHEHRLESPAATAIQAAYDHALARQRERVEEFIRVTNASIPAERLAKKTPEKQADWETLYTDEQRAELKKLREAVTQLEKDGPDLPTTMGVVDDEVIDVPVHLRGDVGKLGEVVPRRVPQVIAGSERPQFTSRASGRLALAHWLVDARHPLTARVAVNRFWRWHFGRGLVATVDNFGRLGETPSHPELLDWLAARFMDDGWSVKSLHRLLVLSQVYQQSDAVSAAAQELDPENRAWSRWPSGRLEAEQLRDGLLAVSGQLDHRRGGSLLQVKNRAYLFDHTSIDRTDYASRRRSIYLPVIRNHLYDFFQLLDFPDPAVPTGDRASTTVAPQALLFLNSPFVMEAAEHLAERLQDADVGAEHEQEQRNEQRINEQMNQRIEALIEMAYSRPATAQDRQLAQQFLQSVTKRLQAESVEHVEAAAWIALCHVTLAANEFLYVR
ncbi:MAG: PSD1 and planctomycete cytochrome C domain-containing protein [Planctomycetota bacterium]